MTVILDACAMIAFLKDETGAQHVENYLKNQICTAHAVNVCEMYYDFFRAAGESAAKEAVADMVSLGLKIREDMDQSFWQEVGRLKAIIKRVSLADCFAISLAKRTNATVITTDHHEFDPIAKMDICRIVFIR